MATIRLGIKPPTLLPPLHYLHDCRPHSIKSLQRPRFITFPCSRTLWLLALCFTAAFVFIWASRFLSLVQLLSIYPSCSSVIVAHNIGHGSDPIPLITSIKGDGAGEQHLILEPSNKSAHITAKRQIPSYRTYGNRCNASAIRRGLQGSNDHKYFLGAVIANRIFESDMFHMTTYDIKQWIEYMFYAGVEHIYWYDTAHKDNESQEAHLVKYVEMGLLTYHRFHKLFPDSIKYGYHFEQDTAYRHFLENYKAEARWVAELDADEYPFSVEDQSSCFLQRTMAQEYERPESALVSQVLMQCLFFLGSPIGDAENAWLIEKYQRRKKGTEGETRQKPIFRPGLAYGGLVSNPHFIQMSGGVTLVAEEKRLRMNHYWGSRATEFGPDTPELLAMLAIDPSVKQLVDDLKAVTGLNNTACTLQAT